MKKANGKVNGTHPSVKITEVPSVIEIEPAKLDSIRAIQARIVNLKIAHSDAMRQVRQIEAALAQADQELPEICRNVAQSYGINPADPVRRWNFDVDAGKITRIQ